MPPAAAEYPVTRNYLDWILSLPWEKATEDKIDLADAERILNEQHFGLDESQRPVAGIPRRHQTPKADQRARSFASSARPASAKPRSAGASPMRWAASLPASPWAACGTKRRFAAIAALTSARMPGRIIQTLRRVESRNPVILLDELDKVGADFRGDPASALLEVLDPGAEQHVHRSLSRSAVRSVARAVHHHGELAGTDSSRVARPARSHRTAELHRIRETADRQTLSRAAPVGGTRPDASRK